MNPTETQQEFISKIGNDFQFRILFDHLPGTCFFFKDRESRLMGASKEVWSRLGLSQESDLIGRTDFEFFPDEISRGYTADDQQVMSTGTPLIDRMEPWRNKGVGLEWSLTTKYPIFDSKGEVLGVMGVNQPDRADRRFSLSPRLAKAVETIELHCAEPLKVDELAEKHQISSRQLNRLFQQELNISFRDFLIRTRILSAANLLLTTDDNVGDIALKCGFYDQSALTRAFKKVMGCSSIEFRQRSRKTYQNRV